MARHGARDARVRHAYMGARKQARPARFRRGRLHASIRALLHEHTDDTRPRGDSVPFGASRRGLPADTRGRAGRSDAGTARALRRRLPRRRRRGAHTRRARSSARYEGRKARGQTRGARENRGRLRAAVLRRRNGAPQDNREPRRKFLPHLDDSAEHRHRPRPRCRSSRAARAAAASARPE